MTTINNQTDKEPQCKASELLRILSGKWKSQIFKLATVEPLRFNTLLRQLNGVNKQSLALALKELEENELLNRIIVKEKPLHIEYTLSAKGESLIPIFMQLEHILDES